MTSEQTFLFLQDVFLSSGVVKNVRVIKPERRISALARFNNLILREGFIRCCSWHLLIKSFLGPFKLGNRPATKLTRAV